MLAQKMSFNWNRVWQVACGDVNRDYRNLFLHYGLIAVGAEWDLGPYHSEYRPYSTKQNPEDDAPGKIWPVAVGMQLHDTVILKKGKHIVAIGAVTGDYAYDGYPDWQERWKDELGKRELSIGFDRSRLDDVDGWDLRHTRQVVWWVGSPTECRGLTRATVQRVSNESVIRTAKEFVRSARLSKSERVLAEPAQLLDNEKVIAELMAHGLSSARSEELAARLQMLQRLAKWYEEESDEVSEHEIRAYLVWPLLQVLGWSEQCVKYQYQNKDLVIFRHPPTEDSQEAAPFLIGETKRMRSGLAMALNQARAYAKKDRSSAVLATDGVRYLLEYASKGKTRMAYMNLRRLRSRHPYDSEVEGAASVLRFLLKG